MSYEHMFPRLLGYYRVSVIMEVGITEFRVYCVGPSEMHYSFEHNQVDVVIFVSLACTWAGPGYRQLPVSKRGYIHA